MNSASRQTARRSRPWLVPAQSARGRWQTSHRLFVAVSLLHSSCCSVQQVAGELVVLLPVNGGFAGVTVEAAGVAERCAGPSAPNLHRPMLSGNTKLSCLSSPLSWPSQTDAASCVCRLSIGIGGAELNSCSNLPVSKLAISRLDRKITTFKRAWR